MDKLNVKWLRENIKPNGIPLFAQWSDWTEAQKAHLKAERLKYNLDPQKMHLECTKRPRVGLIHRPKSQTRCRAFQ